jgi:hypothetical protein
MASKKLFLASTVLFVLFSLPLLSSVVASSEMWSQTYGGAEYDSAYSLVETSDGGYALAGGNRLVKTDEYGNIEWNHTYNGGSAISLIETFDGGFALAGETTSFGAGSSDFWLVRTDEYGIPEFPSWLFCHCF